MYTGKPCNAEGLYTHRTTHKSKSLTFGDQKNVYGKPCYAEKKCDFMRFHVQC